VKSLLRKWLGIAELDNKVDSLLYELAGITRVNQLDKPTNSIIDKVKDLIYKRRELMDKLNNEHGVEGGL